ncbi:MAG TPA: ATP-binding protein [Chryseosolibacter sp.]|nr:ATP-binding protein [Chryseosolibacter sp.]
MFDKRYISFFLAVAFLAAGIFTGYLSFQRQAPSDVADDLAVKVQRELGKVDEDFQRIIESGSFEQIFGGQFHYPIYLFDNGNLIFWSDNRFIPLYSHVADSLTVKLLNNGSESFLLKKRRLPDRKLLVAAVNLIKEYPINNDYLSVEYNKKILPSPNINILDANASLGAPVCSGTICYFRISFLMSEFPLHEDLKLATVVLISISLVLFFVAAYTIAARIKQRSAGMAVVGLMTSFFVVRVLMSQFGFPGNFVDASLFDPQVFAASALNASLGDLLINLILLCLLSFYFFRLYTRIRIGEAKSRFADFFRVFLTGLVILFATLFPVIVIQTLYNNSTLGLDITKVLGLDFIQIVTFICMMLSGVSSFLVCHAAIRFLISHKNKLVLISGCAFAALVFVLVNEFTAQLYLSTLFVAVGYLLVVISLRLYKSLQQLSFETFAYLFVAIFFLAINGALSIQHFSERQKIRSQFKFASNFLVDRDYFGEYLLDEAAQKIRTDAFINARMSNPFLGKDAIRQKIRQVFLPSYFNKYDVNILLYNTLGDPIDGNTGTFQEFISIYDSESYLTDFDGVRFITNPGSDIAQKYIVITPVKRNHTLGYVVIELSLKKIIPETVYPELLVDYRFQQFYRTQDISYAVFVNKSIAMSSGDYNYDRLFDRSLLGDPQLYYDGITLSGYDHIAVEEQSGRVAVVSSRSIPFINKLANFSLLLALGLFTILILIFVQGIYLYFRGTRLFFSARIQLYLNLAFFIPLIIVSVSTLGLTTRSSQQQLDEEYLSKSKIFGQQVGALLQRSGRDLADNANLSSEVSDLAELSNLDANIYDAAGRLIATSQPMIFESNLLSGYINPKAFLEVLQGQNLFIGSERVGKLDYFVSYSVLRSSQTGQVLGILGIPFFQSAYILKKVQSVILINILNIFAFIFIVLLLLSYLVAERLTFPLRFITQSLRKTSLTQHNTPLTWPTNDEIGIMVKEYNTMLYKLAESKSELEQTQREQAWREIAQQVAHEIKNPLTPMKLTLQQLERNVQNGSVTNEKTQRAITTLLTQVETLNEIASSFSGFAKMPAPVMQPVDLVSILKRVIDLHSPTGDIEFKTSEREAYTQADEQLLSRTFSNIVLNAIQSERPGHAIKIQIALLQKEKDFNITFRDNGKGIEPQIADRVFFPHFSTKKTGSGLGLAIAKQGIEQMSGRIWFETELGKGTTFFIELPVQK